MAAPGGYMDGVRVKISEKYKPPPRINLPMSYAQRLTLNKQTQETLPSYDFALEKTVVDKMREWKTARATYKTEQQSRLERSIKVEEERRLKDRKDHQQTETLQRVEVEALGPSVVPTTSTVYQHPSISVNSNILTPIPVKQNVVNFQSQDKSPFNISDFEADTSSPFDNMELKSINDMAVLAQVLNNENELTSQHISPPNRYNAQKYGAYQDYTFNIPNTTTSYARGVSSSYVPNGYYYPPETIQGGSSYNNTNYYRNTVDYNTHVNDTIKSVGVGVPHILKSLNERLDDNRKLQLNSAAQNNFMKIETSEVGEKMHKTDSEQLEVFHSLPKSTQEVARDISSMGFPLSRVARICKELGNDQKKVVEHLLAMSELLDFGFPESAVSEALLKTDNDRDKALDLLTL